MCPCADFMEVYKVDRTFRIYPPESLDPDETDPDMQWVVKEVAEVGTGNEIVARLVIQSLRILDGVLLPTHVTKEALISRFHMCKEFLLECRTIADQIAVETREIELSIAGQHVHPAESGTTLNPFPQVQQLESRASSFLMNAKRSAQELAGLLDLLFSTGIRIPRFNQIRDRIREQQGAESQLYAIINQAEPSLKRIIDMRNALEHPTQHNKLVIENFRLLPGSKVRPPAWHLSSEPVAPLVEEMSGIVGFLIDAAEAVIISSVLCANTDDYPFCVVAIPQEEIDRDCPVRYRLALSTNGLVSTTGP